MLCSLHHTIFMVHRPLLETDSHSASQEISCFYGNQEFITAFTTLQKKTMLLEHVLFP